MKYGIEEVEEIPTSNDLDELSQLCKIPTYGEWFIEYKSSGGCWGFFEWLEWIGEAYLWENV